MKKITNKGFTIIELLIATMVFTTVLILCMEGITRIAKVYVKNASISRTNEFTKSLMEEIANQIKYGATIPGVANPSPAASPWYLCVSGNSYQVNLNTLGTGSVRKITGSGCLNYTQSNLYTSSADIAPADVRILDFSVTENATSKTWNINMRVALGADDLIVDASGATLSGASTYDNFKSATCKSGIAGSEYCAVIPLSTTVTRRMSGL